MTEFQRQMLKAVIRILGNAKKVFEKVLKGEPV